LGKLGIQPGHAGRGAQMSPHRYADPLVLDILASALAKIDLNISAS